jgi:hypothetical protein
MRAAAEFEDWYTILKIMKRAPDNILTQLFGLHSFAKSTLPTDNSSGEGNVMCDLIVMDVLNMCINILHDLKKQRTITYKTFALEVLLNIFNQHIGRVEFFDVGPSGGGAGSQAATEAILANKIIIFCLFFRNLDKESETVFEKGSPDAFIEYHPLPRGVEAAEAALSCLSLLAQESDYKEIIAATVTSHVLNLLTETPDEACIAEAACKLWYNVCYLSEPTQGFLLDKKVHQWPPYFKEAFSGDPGVVMQARRLELCLKKDGWRGNVEALITRELGGEVLPKMYLEEVEEGQITLLVSASRGLHRAAIRAGAVR